MVFELINLFLGSGFALFVALLAWGNQLKQPRKEVLTLENSFRKEYHLPKSVTNSLTKKQYDELRDSSSISFLDQAKAMGDLIEKNVDDGAIEILNKFNRVHDIRLRLERAYNFRYNFSLILCVFLFIFGVVSAFTQDVVFNLFKKTFSFNLFFLFIVLCFVALLIYNMFWTHKKEQVFIESLINIDENIEV